MDIVRFEILEPLSRLWSACRLYRASLRASRSRFNTLFAIERATWIPTLATMFLFREASHWLSTPELRRFAFRARTELADLRMLVRLRDPT